MPLSLFPKSSTLMPHPNPMDPVLVRTHGGTVVLHLKHRNLKAPSQSPGYDLIMGNRKIK